MGAYTYGFLLDEGVMALKERFPKGRAITVADIGLCGKPDRVVVEAASSDSRIIVTSNPHDFVVIFDQIFQARSTRCLNGLVTIPNDHLDWKYLVPLQVAEKQLRYLGETIRWRDVSDENLWVRIESRGRIEVTRLPCPGCGDRPPEDPDRGANSSY